MGAGSGWQMASQPMAMGGFQGAPTYNGGPMPVPADPNAAGGGAMYNMGAHPGMSGLFTPEHMAHLHQGGQPPPMAAGAAAGRPSLELDGYSLSTTRTGLSVLVPTGTRKVKIEAPPGPESAVADLVPMPPGLSPDKQSAALPPGLGALAR